MPTRTALAAHQVQIHVQNTNNSLQCCPWKNSPLSQRKIKTKALSQEPPDNLHQLSLLWISHSTGKSDSLTGALAMLQPNTGMIYQDNIRTAKDIKIFKSLLKTHFFRQAFP